MNVSDTKSLNSTENSTLSSTVEREVGEILEVLLLGEENNSTKAKNSSESSEKPKVVRATVEVIGNESLRFNGTEGDVVNNQTTRQVSGNNTSNANNTMDKNSTSNPWSVLPLFRSLNATLRNSSESTNSSQSRRQTTIIASQSSKNSTEEGQDVLEDSTVDETTDKTSLKVDKSEPDLGEDMMDEEGISTKKPCTTVSCLISRGCSDNSCTPDN